MLPSVIGKHEAEKKLKPVILGFPDAEFGLQGHSINVV
jgi:hypothetical protein